MSAKMSPDKAEAAGHGGSMFKADNAGVPRTLVFWGGTQYGLIFATTRRDGTDLADLFVTRRSSTFSTVHSSCLDLDKIQPVAAAPKVNNRL